MNVPLRPVKVTVRPTASGVALLIVTLVVLVGSATGGGMPLTVLAILCATFSIVAALACWHHTSAVRISAPPPVTAFAHERFNLCVPVANLALRTRAFDVFFALGGAGPGTDSVGAVVTQLAAGDEQDLEVIHRMLPRGVFGQGSIDLWSAFPLGLWKCRLRFRLPNRILVLPRLGRVRRIDRARLTQRGDSGHGGSGRGDEQEVYGVRAWREGESLKPVHWKLSARRGRLLVREFRTEPRMPVQIVLATGIGDAPGDRVNTIEDATKLASAPAAPSRRGAGRAYAFEEAVSFVATLVEHQIDAGHPVRLVIAATKPRTVTCRGGPGSMLSALRALAEVVPEPDVAPQEPPRARRGERTFVVRVGGGPSVTPDGSLTVFDMTDRSVGGTFDRRRRRGRDLLLGVRK